MSSPFAQKAWTPPQFQASVQVVPRDLPLRQIGEELPPEDNLSHNPGYYSLCRTRPGGARTRRAEAFPGQPWDYALQGQPGRVSLRSRKTTWLG